MLKVKKSTLPGAGKGLFTLNDIDKGEIVCEYEGERITWKQAIVATTTECRKKSTAA